jgi:hypothetical protein
LRISTERPVPFNHHISRAWKKAGLLSRQMQINDGFEATVQQAGETSCHAMRKTAG